MLNSVKLPPFSHLSRVAKGITLPYKTTPTKILKTEFSSEQPCTTGYNRLLPQPYQSRNGGHGPAVQDRSGKNPKTEILTGTALYYGPYAPAVAALLSKFA